MKMEVTNVAVAAIEVGKLNPRELNKAELKGSALFKSIKANGVQHPIEVRKVGSKMVLLSGERRLMIAKELKHKTISAVVYSDMTDQEAYDKTHFENQARENLSPIEAAKDALNMLATHNGDRKAAAAKLGLSDRELSLRLKLQKLSPKWQKELYSEETMQGHHLNELSIAHLELIARLDPERQDEMLDCTRDWFADYDGNLVSVADLKSYMDQTYARLLSDVQWDLGSRCVGGVQQACCDCERRSDREDQLGLWGDDNKASTDVSCLDVDCFIKKSRANLKDMLEAARAKHPNLIIVGDRELPEGFGTTTASWKVKACKKSDPHAMPAVTVNGATMSAVQWAKPTKELSSDSSKLPKSEAPKTMAVRREELKGARLRMVYEALDKAIDDHEPVLQFNTVPYLAAMICVFGGNSHRFHTDQDDLFAEVADIAGGKSIKCFIDFGEKEAVLDCKAMLWRKLAGNIRGYFNSLTSESAIRNEFNARKVANLIGFPFDASFSAACQDKPEPKSWAGLCEDGTPKKSRG